MSVRNIIKSIQDIMRKDAGLDGDAQRLSQLCWMLFLKIIDDQDKRLKEIQEDYLSPIPVHLQWGVWAADPEGIDGDELLNFVNTQLFPQLKKMIITKKKRNRRHVVRDVFEDAHNYMKSGHLMRQVINKINSVNFNNLIELQHFGDVYEQLLNDLQSAGNSGEYYTPRAITSFMVDRTDPKPGETLFDPACGTGGFLSCAITHLRNRYKVSNAEIQDMLRAVEKKSLPHMLCITNMLLHGIEDPHFVKHDNMLNRIYDSYENKDFVDIILTNPPFGGYEENGIESNFPKQFQTRETADLFLVTIIKLLSPGGRGAIVLPDSSLYGNGVKGRIKQHLLEECNVHTIIRLPNSVFKPYASVGTNLIFFTKGESTKDIWFYEHQIPQDQKYYSSKKPIRIQHFDNCKAWWGGVERLGRVESDISWNITINEIKKQNYNLDFKNPNINNNQRNYNIDELKIQLEEAEKEVESLKKILKDLLYEALSS